MRGMAGRIGRLGSAAPLLVLVLLVRLLVPSGYMIGPDPSGRPGLVLCGAVAAKPAERPAHHGHERHSDPSPGEAAELPCPYAALSAPPLPPAPPRLAEPEQGPRPAPAAGLARGLARPSPAAPPPPSTGPPPPA
ncbi:MAG TPA: hypothetical protein VF759_02425 [Allosphingosinicella sp.]